MSTRFLLINKMSGPTSHDIIDKLRKITGIKRIGHAGTLDPFASGLLFIAIGRESTRELSKFVGLDKKYIATLKLGAVSDTYDRTGHTKTQKHKNTKTLEYIEVEKVLKKFIGVQKQIPPMYSAKKIKGKKLYELARKGIEVDRKPQETEIYNIKLLTTPPLKGHPSLKRRGELVLRVQCSSGTYIRSLAHDIGQALGCGAYLEELVRTKIGKYKLEDAVELDKLNKNNWQKFCLQKL